MGGGSVRLQRVTKRFGSVEAVKAVDLEIADEEFLVLLGPSGCGKSTVLRLIAGLEEQTDGSISIGSQDVDDLDPKDRDVAMVFQSYALYPHMTVRRNIEFPLRSRHIDAAQRAALVAEAATTLDLDGLLDRKPAQLSGGQRQRVALARAIVRRPRVFLMDEPLSNLDAKLRVQTRAELIDLHRRLRTTVVYVTHDQVEAMTMGDRIAVMMDGALQQVGRPQAVYDKPANLFVARFIGSPPMNTFSGVLADSAVRVAGGRVAVRPELAGAAAERGLGDVVVGVRAEHLTFDGAGEGIAAVVTLVESLGHERLVVCRLDDGALVIVRLGADGPAPADGDTVCLRAEPEHVHLFDPSTAERVDG